MHRCPWCGAECNCTFGDAYPENREEWCIHDCYGAEAELREGISDALGEGEEGDGDE